MEACDVVVAHELDGGFPLEPAVLGVGGAEPIEADLRVVAAELAKMVALEAAGGLQLLNGFAGGTE